MLKRILPVLSVLLVVFAALPALADVALGPRASCSSSQPAFFIGIGVLAIALAVLLFGVRHARRRRREGDKE